MENYQPVAEQPQVAKQPIPFLNREPVAIMATVRAALALAVGFGFDVSAEQIALVIVFIETILALYTRQQVTPFVAAGTTPNVEDPQKTPLLG